LCHSALRDVLEQVRGESVDAWLRAHPELWRAGWVFWCGVVVAELSAADVAVLQAEQ
jgi:hypothetical protein